MTTRIQAVIFDWAGTVVDYGCFAPMHAFLQAFEQAGVPIEVREAREPMGLLKRDHIRAILQMERVREAWKAAHGADPSDRDTEQLYAAFEAKLMESLEQFADPIPGVLDTVERLRQQGFKIGSTTGYTKRMMEVVAPQAASKGYSPDYLVCSDEVKAGRPYPYMIYRNLYELGVFPPGAAVKVGDTVSDVQEAVNAGVWAVAVVRGSSELGLTEAEVKAIPAETLRRRMDDVRRRFEEAGAHLVIESIETLPEALEELKRCSWSSERSGGCHESIL